MEKEKIQERSGCKVVNKVKYLGVEITNKNIDLLNNNNGKLWKDVKKDLLKWNKLKLSLLGRIATIKMNILPRILYLFQTIPIIRKRSHFLYWKRELTDFIWAGKKPRIKYKVMCDARKRGGLNLPDLELYHDACALIWIQDWITTQNKKLLTLEGFNATFGWHAYLLYGKEKVDPTFKHHYIRGALLQVWLKHKKYLPLERPPWIISEEVIHSITRRYKDNPMTSEDLWEKKENRSD